MSNHSPITSSLSLVFRASVSPASWRIVWRGAVLEALFETQSEADAHLDSLLAVGASTAATPLSPIHRVLRSKATLAWMRADLPGCGNSLHDLAQGYASFIDCPACEVNPVEDAPYDPALLAWVYERFSSLIESHSMGLI